MGALQSCGWAPEVTPAVLDTNVLISALLFDGPPAQLVSAWQSSRFRPVVSAPILEEYYRVLAYPKFALTVEEIHVLIEEIFLPYAETVRVKNTFAKVGRDPDDAKFVECALSGNVPWVVSGDADLLELRQIESVRIVTVAQFLIQLETSP